jgi:methylase of polypeptide subunit release factors
MLAGARLSQRQAMGCLSENHNGLLTDDAADRALVWIGRELLKSGYRFTTITPASHAIVQARPAKDTHNLREIFGWSMLFGQNDLPRELFDKLEEAEAVERRDGQCRSKVRFSTLGGQIFAHSAFPTTEADAVFFGPDTYRFARALRHSVLSLAVHRGMRVLDVGAGSGAGGLHAAFLLQNAAPDVTLTDINDSALRFSRINAALNGLANTTIINSDLYSSVEGTFDLIISNPPYLVDPLARTYRHGGGELGSALSVRIAEEGIERLRPGGRLLLYTGSAIVEGVDALYETLCERLADQPVRFSYDEIDPDVFGEELGQPPYDRADRIAAVAATIDMT